MPGWCRASLPRSMPRPHNEGMNRQLHLNLFIQSRGHHEASWRHPASSPLPLTDIEYYRDLARRAEAGLFDSIFLADTLALMDTVAHAATNWLEPVTALAALAGSTRRIGLIATALLALALGESKKMSGLGYVLAAVFVLQLFKFWPFA